MTQPKTSIGKISRFASCVDTDPAVLNELNNFFERVVGRMPIDGNIWEPLQARIKCALMKQGKVYKSAGHMAYALTGYVGTRIHDAFHHACDHKMNLETYAKDISPREMTKGELDIAWKKAQQVGTDAASEELGRIKEEIGQQPKVS